MAFMYNTLLGIRADHSGLYANAANTVKMTSYRPEGGETICPPPADGSSTVAKVETDLRPSADGSAVLRTSLVAGGG